MIEIKRVEDKRLFDAYIKEAGIPCPEGALMFAVGDEDGAMGFVLYREDGELLLSWRSPQMGLFDLTDGLVRAVLNSLELSGIPRAFCRNPALYPICERIGFTRCEEGMEVSLGSLFECSSDQCAHCNKKCGGQH